MVELERVYWSRHALPAAHSAVVLSLGASVVLALMRRRTGGQPQRSHRAELLRGIVDGVLAAVALPALLLVVLTIVAAVICARYMRRRTRCGGSQANSGAKG